VNYSVIEYCAFKAGIFCYVGDRLIACISLLQVDWKMQWCWPVHCWAGTIEV